MIKYQKNAENIVTLTMDMDGRATNIINHEIGRAFVPCLEQLRAEKAAGRLSGVIITSAKQSFLMGGDLDYLYKATDAAEVFGFAQKQKELFRGLELLGVPVVAAINGSVMGSGYELTLACHHRICLDNPAIKIGMPEVTLGLVPGAGGCVRLLWRLGIEQAFSLLTDAAQSFSPQEAKQKGLIDATAHDTDSLLHAATEWIRRHPNHKQPWDTGAKIALGTPLLPAIAQKVVGISAQLTKKTHNNYPAPRAVIAILNEGALTDFDTAMRIESRYFAELVCSQTTKNMIKAFWYDLNDIKEGGSRPRGIGRFRPRKLGIIGAGMMGSGIAYQAALCGLDVVLKDVSKTIAERGKEQVGIICDKQIKNQKLSAHERNAILAHIATTEQFSDFEGCDVVIEAVFENKPLKAKVTKDAEPYLDKYSLMASNTSTIPITDLAKASIRPENFIGLHFFSPAEQMPLVEIVTGAKTSQESLARAFDLVKLLRKTPIVVRDARGFYTTRVFSRYILEGMAMLAEGHAPTTIENAGRYAGMPMGPLALTDELSLQLAFDIEQEAKNALGDTYQRHPAMTVLETMVLELKRFGKAKGAGFYDYTEGAPKQLWADLAVHFPPNAPPVPLTELQERLLLVQSIEATRCMQEGIIENAADANVGSILGWGFPVFQGGTLQYAEAMGAARFRERCAYYETKFGERYKL